MVESDQSVIKRNVSSKVVDTPVVVQRQVPIVQTVVKTAEYQQLRSIDKVIEILPDANVANDAEDHGQSGAHSCCAPENGRQFGRQRGCRRRSSSTKCCTSCG